MAPLAVLVFGAVVIGAYVLFETAERFNAARRPFTLVGIETFRYKLQPEVRALAERLGRARKQLADSPRLV